MNHTQLTLLDELLVSGDLKRHDNGWLIGDAENMELVALVTEFAAFDNADLDIRDGTIGVRFSDGIQQYLG